MSTAKGRVRAKAPWIIVTWKDPMANITMCEKFPYFEKDKAFELSKSFLNVGYDSYVFEATALSHSGVGKPDC